MVWKVVCTKERIVAYIVPLKVPDRAVWVSSHKGSYVDAYYALSVSKLDGELGTLELLLNEHALRLSSVLALYPTILTRQTRHLQKARALIAIIRKGYLPVLLSDPTYTEWRWNTASYMATLRAECAYMSLIEEKTKTP